MSDFISSKIYTLLGPRQICVEVENITPLEPNRKHIVAETLFSAISPGTEMAAYIGEPPLRPVKPYPRVVGYCNVGRILTAHPNSEFKKDDIILTFQSHRSSFQCTEDRIIARIPTSSNLAHASVTYLFHLGYQTLLAADFRPGHNIAIIGMGTLGIASASLASLFCAQVFCFSDQMLEPELVNRLAIKDHFKKDDDAAQETILAKTDNTGIDIVILTTNSWNDWLLALKVVRRGGTICVLGFPGRSGPLPDFNPLDSQYFYDKQIRIKATGFGSDLDVAPSDIRFTVKRNCSFLLRLILEKKLDPETLITSVEPWDRLETLYNDIVERKKSVRTYVLKWK